MSNYNHPVCLFGLGGPAGKKLHWQGLSSKSETFLKFRGRVTSHHGRVTAQSFFAKATSWKTVHFCNEGVTGICICYDACCSEAISNIDQFVILDVPICLCGPIGIFHAWSDHTFPQKRCFCLPPYNTRQTRRTLISLGLCRNPNGVSHAKMDQFSL